MKSLIRTRAAIGAGLIAATTLMLVGCSDTSPIEGSAPSGGQSGGDITSVGLLLQDVSNPYFATMKKAVEDRGAQDGFTVNVQDGQQDVGMQNNQIDAMVQQGVDVILLNAVDTDGIGEAVKRALDAGIVVVGVDVDAQNAQAVVMTDNVEAGRQACTSLAEKIGGSGNILVINGTQVTSVQDRAQGCKEVLKQDYPDITIVGEQNGKNDIATGQSITTDLLTANSDVQGIFGINDPTARGAVLAVEQANRSGIWVTGVDGSPEAVELMKTANSSFWATSAQDPAEQALKALDLAKQIKNGETPAERVTLIDPTLVDRDNVDSYKGWDIG